MGDTLDKIAAAQEALRAAGLDRSSPEYWVRKRGVERVHEVLTWASRQKWFGDPERQVREIVAALRDGHGHAPKPTSEAAAVETRETIPVPTPEERQARRRRLAVMAIMQHGPERPRLLSTYAAIPEEEWAGYVEEARIKLSHDREEWANQDADPAWRDGQKANAMLDNLCRGKMGMSS